MFEWLLLNVETYLAATVVAQKSMEYFKNYAAWAPLRIPWVPEVFLACGGNFRCRSKGHYKDLTETGKRARKVSGTQGTLRIEPRKINRKRYSRP